MSQEDSVLISFKNVSKSYGSVVALRDISLEIKKGEFVFLTGPSGSGKTTVLKLILREIISNKGEVLVDGANVAKLEEKNIPLFRQKVGVIFQDFKVLPDRTVYENVAVALNVIGLPEDKWEERIKHVLGLVGLENQINMFPSQLSGGELQRVSLARALSVNPKIILADEPTGNLDWETSDVLMKLLEKVNKEGKTIVMATHNMEIVNKYKKRVIHIEKTKLAADEERVSVSDNKSEDKRHDDKSAEEEASDTIKKK